MATIAASVAAGVVLSYYVLAVADISTTSRAIYFILFLCLLYCSLAYQINRFGTAVRRAVHRPIPEASFAPLFTPDAPTVTVLIPSYREERRVLRMTILSAALARYSLRRIVVLIDDPPNGPDVAGSRAVVEEVRSLLAQPMGELRAEREAFLDRLSSGLFDRAEESRHVRALYLGVVDWLDTFADQLGAQVEPEFEHVDRFNIDRVVLDLAQHYADQARRLIGLVLDEAHLVVEYDRLATLFCTEIASFERKQFANLSQAPNKAMNLNSYIGLMGGSYSVSGSWLVADDAPNATLSVPASKYVLTLDADSVILRDYVLDLVHVMEKDGRVAVAQTPYLTFPNSKSPVERIAGATTDIQHLVHQGSSFYEAAYWVGANALIRLAALDSIHTVGAESDKEVDVFIQDQTVIEDTGSTIDLLGAGWTVHNHFRALAYSSTPADFGSLAIQRQRWSNGGLIIFPTLLRQYLSEDGKLYRFMEFALRSHYLLSPLIGNGAVFLLMILASSDAHHMIWMPLAMVPYFVLYGIDLRRSGYKFGDLFAVSALNLLLLPIGFAGVLGSVRQMLSGKKAPFSRTPKVAGRTATGAGYILFNVAMLLLMARYVFDGLLAGDVVSSLVPAVNLLLYVYGFHRFIGSREAIEDLLLSLSLGLKGRGDAGRSRGLRPQRAPAYVRFRYALASIVGLAALLMPVTFGSADSAGVPASGFLASEDAVTAPQPEMLLAVGGRVLPVTGNEQFYDWVRASGRGGPGQVPTSPGSGSNGD